MYAAAKSGVNSMRERTRFSLPEKCACGASGAVTFEAGDIREPGKHPDLKVVVVEGPFRLDNEAKIVCTNCEDRSNIDAS